MSSKTLQHRRGRINRIDEPRQGLRIAQVAPLFESVPPQKYGGTERVVAYLCDELVRQGHDVTLFASGDSRTRARLVAACKRSLRTSGDWMDSLAPHVVALDQLRERADEFDVIHYHTGYEHFALARALPTARVTTLHGRLDLPDIAPFFSHFIDEPLISVSDAQRAPIPWANWVCTVHHGLPANLLRFRERSEAPEPYLLFVGRISREKRPDRAIEIARLAERPLKIAAKVDAADREYFEREIRPLLSHPGVEFIGEVDEREKEQLMGDAEALLFPIDWPEPFGLVMIESMACGTPVIAYPHGSVREVVTDGRTGFLCESERDAARAVKHLHLLDRRECRAEFERRFLASRMAEDYVKAYRRLLASAHRVTETES